MADEPSLDNNDDLADIEAMLRDLDADELELVAPPAEVWVGIESALDADRTAEPVANIVSISSRRNRWIAPALAVAAAAVLAVAGIVVFSGRGSSTPDVLASAQLAFDADRFDPLGENASATVSLIDADNRLELTIDQADLPTDLSEPADLEIWLIEPDADGNVVDLVSLGVVHPDDDAETFPVPAGYDPAVYTVVDISVEPRDGNHDHSGRSILRGALTDA